jgi:hypothetical protein
MITHLSGGGELGDSLGALGDGVLGELTGEEEADGSLDLAGREGALLVVAREAGSLEGESLKDVVDERVEDGHASLGDASVGVDLLQHSVDVGGVGFHSLGLLLATHSLLGGLSSLLANSGSLSHFD